jgi:hypothetical protein
MKEVCKNMKDCIAASKKFEHLKKEEIPAIADEDLRFAIMSWISGQISDDCSNEFKVISSLPKPCQNVYACCAIADEICNGGFNQLFFNATVQLIQIAREGFLEMGEEEIDELLEKAIEIYHDNEEKLQQFVEGACDSAAASFAQQLFHELDSKVVCHEKEFDAMVVAYIRKNEEYFGD